VRRSIEELVSRVVHAHQRVELHAQGKATIREQPNVSAEVERALVAIQQQHSTARAGQMPAGMTWQAIPGVQAPVGAPGLDLDRLTDQIVTRIDDRLIAHRERLGRAT
jgi:hypothetical protein